MKTVEATLLSANSYSKSYQRLSVRMICSKFWSSKTKTPSNPPAATPHPTAKDSTASTPSSPKPRENASKKMNLNKNKNHFRIPKKRWGLTRFNPHRFFHGRCFTTNHRDVPLSSHERSECLLIKVFLSSLDIDAWHCRSIHSLTL